MSKYFNFGNCVSMGNGSVTINNKTIKVPANASISVVNGKLYVDGKEYKDKELKDKQIINITIEGNVNKVDCAGSVTVNGNVNGYVDCGGSASISGKVEGDIDCGGSCTVRGGHKGDIDAGGSVSIR